MRNKIEPSGTWGAYGFSVLYGYRCCLRHYLCSVANLALAVVVGFAGKPAGCCVSTVGGTVPVPGVGTVGVGGWMASLS